MWLLLLCLVSVGFKSHIGVLFTHVSDETKEFVDNLGFSHSDFQLLTECFCPTGLGSASQSKTIMGVSSAH